MTRPRNEWTASPTETPAETVARLEQEIAQLRWERDHLAAQSVDVARLWWELTETVAECDNLRAEIGRLRQEEPRQYPNISTPGTDQLAWITMAVSGQIPDSLVCNSESR